MEIEDLIQARPAGHSQKTTWYRELLEAADQHGLSASELADRAGCSLGTIYNWRRRLSNGSSVNPAPEPAAQRLVRVHVPANPTPPISQGAFELRLRHGRSVIVPNQFDSHALASLVEVLEQC